LVLQGSDVGKIFFDKYARYNKPMPFARAICPDPISALVSGVPVGLEVNECEVAGGMLKEPVQLVKCKTVDLEVPAHAEVILEGEILPNVTIEEGPFGEWLGFTVFARTPQTVFKVNCITYRNDPMLGVANMGMPVNDDHLLMSVAYSAWTKRLLQAQGVPVKDVFYPPYCGGTLCVVSTETPYANVATHIANIVFGSRGLDREVFHLIIVNPDVDPFNLNEVMHSLANLCNPMRGITIRDKEVSNPLMPFSSPEEQRWLRGSKAVYDCTWPVDWPKEKLPAKASFRTYPQQVQEKVLQNWTKYGFKEESHATGI
jgi:4-hydroxy-3-polyprenylbenzoate decarboxylase